MKLGLVLEDKLQYSIADPLGRIQRDNKYGITHIQYCKHGRAEAGETGLSLQAHWQAKVLQRRGQRIG